jgi:nicotinate-nucleotide pyrophosphorylase (carboxylating)
VDEEIQDIRHQIYQGCMDRWVTGALIAEGAGVLSGINRAQRIMTSLGLSFVSDLTDGSILGKDQEIARVTGNPIQIVAAEEQIIGTLSKSSGIATAASRARVSIGKDCQIVTGGWKKMPLEVKDLIRKSAQDGGIDIRISEKPFVYLDKNYVRILGGIKEAIQKVLNLDQIIVIQIRGETEPIQKEAIEAAQAGANVIMVDTGQKDHLVKVVETLKEKGLRDKVRIAFAGNISLEDIKSLAHMDVDIVDIGYAILDAPCLPMRFDVIKVEEKGNVLWTTDCLKRPSSGYSL